MKIYVQSAGETKDFNWKGDLSTASSYPPLSWHGCLKEEDKALALLAGYADGAWHVEYRNLILPGITDLVNRQIVQNIIFSGLQSNDAVKALVHAYLDIDLQFKNSGRPVGRVCPELVACYAATDDGDFDFDCGKAKAWAEQVINAYKPDALRKTTSQSIAGSLNPASVDEVQQLHKLIDTLELDESNGLQIALSQISTVRERTLRIKLTSTDAKGAWDVEQTSVRNPQSPAPVKPNPPKTEDAEETPNPAKELAIGLFKEAEVELSEATQRFYNRLTGKNILVIFMLLMVSGLSILIFYQVLTENDKHIAVKKTTKTAPSVSPPKQGEQQKVQTPTAPADTQAEKKASIDATEGSPQIETEAQ